MIKPRSATGIDRQVGLRIRTMRTEQRVSQDQLAKKLDISFQQIQKYEKGVNRLSLSRAVEIAKALKTTVNELIGIDGAVIPEVTFNRETFLLAQSFERLRNLSPDLVDQYKRSIDTVCRLLEAQNGKRKKRR